MNFNSSFLQNNEDFIEESKNLALKANEVITTHDIEKHLLIKIRKLLYLC